MSSIVVAALYKFVRLDDYKDLRDPLLEVMETHHVRGSILLADEGINGTVAGFREEIDALLVWLKSDPRLTDLDHKESYAEELPFFRSKVRLKKEIVTLGVGPLDPERNKGTYVPPAKWNELIADPDVTLIDARNQYEVSVGTFAGAIDPGLTSFREFPQYAEEHLDPSTHKKVAMFCTGGIRCEKSVAYLKQQGFDEVYQLHGGILKYLEDVPEEESAWQGDCFVFDQRVAVNHRLERGRYEQCNACRMPITAEDQAHPSFEEGVSCPHCYDTLTEEQRQGRAEREKQVRLAAARGEPHLGADVVDVSRERKSVKMEMRQRQRDESRS